MVRGIQDVFFPLHVVKGGTKWIHVAVMDMGQQMSKEVPLKGELVIFRLSKMRMQRRTTITGLKMPWK